MLPEIKHILCATDLSENANHALRHALSMAQAHKAKVHVINVTEPMSSDAIVTMQMFIQDDASRKKAMLDRREAAKELLRQNQQEFVKALSEADKKAYECVASVEHFDGHPAECILQRAKLLKCDLIVMGSHEQGTGHTFVGSVVKRVLRRSSIPTLVVPQPR